MASGLVAGGVRVRTPRPGLVIAAATVASANVFMNVAAISALLPVLGRSLSASETQLQWIGDVYPLVLAALLLPAGTLIDRWGRRSGMLAGLLVMSIGQLASAMASSPGELIAARGITGAAAAFVFPATLATVSSALPADRRDKAVSIWAGGLIVGGSFGMVATVLLLESVRWPWVFVFIGVVSLLCLVLVAVAVPESRGAVEGPLDVVGGLLAAVAVGGIVAAINEGPVDGWSAPVTVACAGAGVLSGIAFVLWERRAAHPLLDMHVFANRALSASAVTLVALFAADFGMFFLLYQDRAFVYGDSALHTTLLILCCFVAFPPSMPIGTRWAARSGLRPVMTTAMLVCGAAFAIVSTMGVGTSALVMIVALNIFWFGVGLAMTPATRGILDALPLESQGIASAVNDLTRELGVAIGVAALGSAFTVGYRRGVGGLAAALPDGTGDAVRRSPATALLALTGPTDQGAVHTVQQAVVTGWRAGLLAGVAILVLGAAGAWLLIPARVGSASPAVVPSVVPSVAHPSVVGGPALATPSGRTPAWGVGAAVLVVGGLVLLARRSKGGGST